ncbi:MAG: hypothetical protein WDO15_10650 [Bacteroidota bacterium]
MTTYTDVPGTDYSYTYIVTGDNRTPKGQYKLTINHGDYLVAGAEVTGDAMFLSDEDNGSSLTYTWGLFDEAQYNLFTQLAEQDVNTAEITYRHLYKENVKAGESMTVSEEDFDTFPLTPSHNVTYPEASQLQGTWATLSGVWSNGGTTTLYIDHFDSDEQIGLTYPDIANLFPSIEARLTPTMARASLIPRS